ncbi:MAG: aldo/keto reductase [Puniceicoccaceae bacterium]
MNYRKLGRSGLQLSELSFGAWVTFGDPDSYQSNLQCLEIAYQAGVNFFDNAESYADGEAEVAMGKIIRELGWRRDSFCVSSKVFFGIDQRKPTQRGTSRKHLTDACHGALQRLKLDYLDLFFCHRYDPATPVEEVVWSMNDLIAQGKILYWGTSEWSATQIDEAFTVAQSLGLRGPTMEQPQYNLLHRHRFEVEYAPLYEKYQLGTTIWSPLASGLLTGKYTSEVPQDSRLAKIDWLREAVLGSDWDSKREALKALAEVARQLDCSLPELSLAWCLKNPHVSTVILGASKPEQLRENLRALEKVELLTPDLLATLDGLFPVRR